MDVFQEGIRSLFLGTDTSYLERQWRLTTNNAYSPSFDLAFATFWRLTFLYERMSAALISLSVYEVYRPFTWFKSQR